MSPSAAQQLLQQVTGVKILGQVVAVSQAFGGIAILTHSNVTSQQKQLYQKIGTVIGQPIITNIVQNSSPTISTQSNIASNTQQNQYYQQYTPSYSSQSLLQVSPREIALIRRDYGDQLLERGDTQSALEEYVKTIPYVEPGCIIAKLTARHEVSVLMQYLLKLHTFGVNQNNTNFIPGQLLPPPVSSLTSQISMSPQTSQLTTNSSHTPIFTPVTLQSPIQRVPMTLATPNHTTLLINCFTELSDQKALDQFLNANSTTFLFDVDTAIRVCFQAGFEKQALQLADSAHRHDWAMRIILEGKIGGKEREVEKIREKDQIEKNSSNVINSIGSIDGNQTPTSTAVLNVIERIRKLSNLQQRENAILKYGKQLLDYKPIETTGLLIDMCTTGITDQKNQQQSSQSQQIEQIHTPTKIDSVIHLFVQQPAMLIIFLSTCQKFNPEQSKTYKFHTYSIIPNSNPYPMKHTIYINKYKAMMIYDVPSVLEICKHYNFRWGVLFLYGRVKAYRDILRYYMGMNMSEQAPWEQGLRSDEMDEEERYRAIVETCEAHGGTREGEFNDPRLWNEALTYLSSLHASKGECTTEVRDQYIRILLQKVRSVKDLPPLPILQILSSNPEITIGTAIQFINSCLFDAELKINDVQQQCEKIRSDVGKRNRETRALRNITQVFDIGNCTHCNQRLEVPCIHFFCGHSFHTHCLMDESQCNECASHIRDVKMRMAAVRRRVAQSSAENRIGAGAGSSNQQQSQLYPSISMGNLWGLGSSSSSGILPQIQSQTNISQPQSGLSSQSQNQQGEFDQFMNEVGEGGFPVIVNYFSKGLLNKALCAAEDIEAAEKTAQIQQQDR
ncbi:MAG: putative vacuolar protein sorting-associated protein 11 [Streblomastix strix]|uniref:Putative vacuolar protein sorting-associated protein 11 n=1 Tax=Streblomastix strix TaxID=222440 RepID=A0A5J4W2T6_9EUKA|nr:MAG: putative vacuolar protein sorting-associated protein 11 [Streblomastix strix]